jgi:vesicle-associated membrane protein 7
MRKLDLCAVCAGSSLTVFFLLFHGPVLLVSAMVENIDGLLARGERIDLLVDRTDALHESSFNFKRGAARLKDLMWWQNTKLLLAVSAGGAGLLYIIIASSCGGLTWPEC